MRKYYIRAVQEALFEEMARDDTTVQIGRASCRERV